MLVEADFGEGEHALLAVGCALVPLDVQARLLDSLVSSRGGSMLAIVCRILDAVGIFLRELA